MSEQSSLSIQDRAWAETGFQEVEKIWGRVYEASEKVIRNHLNFGFTAFVKNMNPRIEDIILGLKAIESLLDTLGNQAELDYSSQRIIFNCKQQILLLQEVSVALQNSDKDFYEQAMGKLKSQSPI
jgi:hypothetical protein